MRTSQVTTIPRWFATILAAALLTTACSGSNDQRNGGNGTSSNGGETTAKPGSSNGDNDGDGNGGTTKAKLKLSRASLDVSPGTSKTLTITNTGAAKLSWKASVSATWLILSESSGSLGAGKSRKVTVSTRDVPAGKQSGDIRISSNGGASKVAVTVTGAETNDPPRIFRVTLRNTGNGQTLGRMCVGQNVELVADATDSDGLRSFTQSPQWKGSDGLVGGGIRLPMHLISGSRYSAAVLHISDRADYTFNLRAVDNAGHQRDGVLHVYMSPGNDCGTVGAFSYTS